ncbi:MAG: hypothetical protein E7384_01730 [Ruminococcaceae bacterium]|nr:hypothetical protein [Oscillospiraceae bacterium]
MSKQVEEEIQKVDTTKYVYIILTRTHTKFAGLIRKMMRKKYNHASISFTEDLKDVYTMGRYRHTTPIMAGPIKEYSDRLCLKQKVNVPCVIYKVPVSESQYDIGLRMVNGIMGDRDKYLYNLYSVLAYPVLHGFSTPKAYSCSEFVAHILRSMHVDIGSRRLSCYTPWHLHEELKEYVFYEGDIIPLMAESNRDNIDYFSTVGFFTVTGGSMSVLWKLIYRVFAKGIVRK